MRLVPCSTRSFRFQFPTGWNSTQFLLPLLLRFPVSIPNGMEFYSKKRCETARQKCFNSQRDGILLKSSPFFTVRSGFQFPTGWNSTLSFRDVFVEACWFQFPTGWNSTVIGHFFAIIAPVVSIPNGMEFYSTNCAIFLDRKC